MTLSATHLKFMRGERAVLDDAALRVAPGEFVGILGVNGAGKTTLLRLLAGLLRPMSGEVMLDGATLSSLSHETRARHIGYLAQDAACAWPMPVRDVVALGRLAHAKRDDLIEAAMREADVTHLADRRADALSGGEQRRVQLARALAGEPRILLADEPVAGLDPAHQLHTLALLRAKAEAGMGVLASLHDVPLAIRYCHRLALLHGGKMVCEGPWQEVCTPARMAETLGVKLERVTIGGVEVGVPWRQV